MKYFARVLILLSVLLPMTAHAGDKKTSWRDLSTTERRAIVTEWENLPEATRPPFPVFRDARLDKKTEPKNTEQPR